MERGVSPPARGRGAAVNPAGRFERLGYEPDGEPSEEGGSPPATQLLRDDSRSVISRNESPDVGMRLSVNPHRGCEHGCSYCFARPTHEYLGLSAGLDFETRIFVKEAAPELLASELAAPRYEPEPMLMSGVTDPYQPAERRLLVTRRCLEVIARFRQPVCVLSKSELVARDADLLADLAKDGAAAGFLSITTLDPELSRLMEPRASTPERRLAALSALRDSGVPCGVMVAPSFPA